VIKKLQKRRPRPDLGCSAIGWMDSDDFRLSRINSKTEVRGTWHGSGLMIHSLEIDQLSDYQILKKNPSVAYV
jgi:hypothetical protein